MIRVLIVDRDQSFGEFLKDYITNHHSDIIVAGSAQNIKKVDELINCTKPDLLFLDMMLPISEAFKVLKRTPRIKYSTIITSTRIEHALQAFKFSAFDFLLKPAAEKELKTIFQKYRISKEISKPTSGPDRVVISVSRSTLILPPGEIIRIEADLRKSKVYLKNNTIVQSIKGMAHYESSLTTSFFRVHREHIINLNEVREFVNEKNGGWVVMCDKKAIPVAARRKKLFLDAIGISHITGQDNLSLSFNP